jgi:sec-independent protein translocase protein TatA
MIMFGFSGEHLLVLLVILLIFGPKRLPDLGHSLGRTLKNFKDAMSGVHQESPPQIPSAPPASAQQDAEAAPKVETPEKVEPKG